MMEITDDLEDEREDDEEPRCENLRHVFIGDSLVCVCGKYDRRKHMAE